MNELLQSIADKGIQVNSESVVEVVKYWFYVRCFEATAILMGFIVVLAIIYFGWTRGLVYLKKKEII